MSRVETNRAFGRTVVAFLKVAGVGRVFLSPGARSSPVVAALAESHMECVIHYDERGMAFAALGCAMASGGPAVCLTTSGSAVANLLPACVEAFQSHVPLVFLTADRPADLRGTGANQTIMQPGLFGSYVRYEVDVTCPSEVGSCRDLEQILAAAFRAATGDRPGPVHVNLQFREPLLEEGPMSEAKVDFFQEIAPVPKCVLPDGWESFSAEPRGVVVIGRLDAREQKEAEDAVALGDALGWPVVADALSGARHIKGVVRHADWLLRRKDTPCPRRVLQFGGSLVSKRLGEWIARSCEGGEWWQVKCGDERWDPWGKSPQVVSAPLRGFCHVAAGVAKRHGDSPWLSDWRRADAKVADVLDRMLECPAELSEPAIARVVGRHARDLFLGNSMPVRDFDSSDACVSSEARWMYGNRGASGIDGNVATIAGVARGCGRPVVGLLGDLATLHDLNSLALLRELPVTLVVVNNDGGGIFRFLPLNVDENVRERFWETPHGMDFAHAAAQFGIPWMCVEDTEGLEVELSKASAGPRLIECRTDRARNHALHDEIAREVHNLSMEWST